VTATRFLEDWLQVAGALPFGRGSRFGGAVLCARVHGTCDSHHLVDAIVALRLERPSWGPRKIVAKLALGTTRGDLAVGLHGRRDPENGRAWFVVGGFGWRAPPRMGQLTVPQHANHVWWVDHKGWIRLGDGLARRAVDDDGRVSAVI